MSDNATVADPNPAPTQPAQGGGQPAIPAGHRLVPETDWTAAERNRERLTSLEKQWGDLKKSGVPVDNLRDWASVYEAAGKRKLSPREAARLLAGEETQAAEDRNGDGKAFDPEKFKADVLSEAESRMSRREAVREHDAAEKAEEAAVEKIAEKLSKGDEVLREVYENALKRAAVYARTMRDPDDPLHGDGLRAFAPLNAKQLAEFEKSWDDKHAARAGKEAAQIGKAAASQKAPTSPAAGNSGGQGKPSTTSDKPKTILEMTRAEGLAELEKIRAKRGGGPVSG